TSEPTEQFSLTVGGVTGTGTILDDDGTPGITHVGDTNPAIDGVTVNEGDAAVFTVNLSNPSSTATTFALTLSDGTAVLGGDYTANLSFTNGVSYDPATGLVTVPANVTSFTVTVPTVEDSTSEPTEQFSLTVGGVTGTGTILDDDVADLGEVAATPEDTPLSGNVLDNASTPVGTLEVTGFSVAGLAGSYAPGQTATVNGVGTFTLDSLGNYTFTPHEDYAGPVPTVTYTVSNGGSSTDSTLELSVTPVADVPDVTLVLGTPVPVSTTIDSSNVGQVGQGYTVTAYNPNGSLGTVSTVSGQGSGGLVSGFGVAGAASGADGEVGYANNSAEKLVVNFTTPVTSATVQLAWLSATERASYTLYDAGGNVIGSGQVQGVTDVIDSPFVLTGANGAEISRIEFSAPRSGDDYLVHSITFNTAATYPVTLTATPTDIDYSESVLSVTVSVPAGATLSAGTDNGNGTWTLPLVSSGAYTVTVDPVTQAVSISGLSLTVPNGVAGTITAVATVQDGVDTEVGSASVTVLGDHTVIGIVHVGGSSAGVTNVTVDEGNAAVFTVNLSGSSPTPTSFALSLAEGTATQGEDYNANLSFSNGVTYDAATGKITVPAGVSSFTVSVPTLNDSVPEPSQTFSLTVGGITGTGTILDNDGTIVIGGGGGGQDNGDNTIGGTSGSDVLLGDVGGSLTTSMAATNYNISLIVDVSGSMSNASGEPGLTRMALTKQALENFADKLLDHDGIINLQMVAFSSGASTTVNINNLSASNIQTLLDAIDALAASGGTNYEAAFNQAVAWFNAQTSAGYNAAADYENVTYFLTDGDPTFYLDDSGTVQGPGNSTTYATLLNSVEAFAPLSAVSTVNGIGIGSGVNENYLRFFDNSAVTGNASATFSGTESIVLASFTGTSPGQLGSISAWTTTGSGTATISNSRLNITDPNGGGATVVTSAPVTVTEAQSQSYFTFDFATSSWNNADRLNWQLQRLGDNGWETVSSATLSSGATDVTTAAVGAGQYRFVFSVTDNSSGSGSAQARITDIRLEVPNIVEGTVGAPEIVNNASQFAAALEGSSTGLELVPVGNDTVSGGDGNDIIFGDVINTDSLPWGVGGNPARPADLLDGSGVSALETFLTLRNGSAPTEQELYDYIRANHEQFNVAGDARGGNDTLDGGAGDDILYGQGGNDHLTGGAGNDLMYGGLGADTFAWELHDQGTPGKPAVDTVMDFDTTSNSDKLDLRDLLVGEQHTGNDVGNLMDYLHFEVNAQGSTVVQISTSGAFSSGYSETAVDQSIILNGVDLVSGAGDQQQIIQDLLTRGKLVAD
uniref:beta strand repeat-containing protein n=1 Tax=Azovibrio restrictus TaxID=146938 RepID=UPI0004799CB4